MRARPAAGGAPVRPRGGRTGSPGPRRLWRVCAAIALIIAFALPVGPAAADSKQEGRALFREGYTAFSEGRWQEAAEKMRDAHRTWSENPSTARVYDRWFEPYLPLFYLGRALDKMGCRTEALAALGDSPLCQGSLPGRERERQSCRDLAERLRQTRSAPGAREPRDCARFTP